MTLEEELENRWNQTNPISFEDIEYRKKNYREANIPQENISRHLEEITPTITKQIFFLVRNVNEVNVLSLYADSLEQLKEKVEKNHWVADFKSVPDSILIFVKQGLQ